ncbi:DUF1871 family protein [Bacillus taeanensis]|uniref:DUF1871 domain-containing protein n=1 Tax=Bacillus taeanensis TaxID=273032 RepID=A0A366Y0G2_9BACI|nr:DUF1871 family protein [Bacillus taeanensis]RBW71336.1 DUF1871 domain-containing protein [Bacillus taeanensis]
MNPIQKTNLQLLDVLNQWDPFHLGEGTYETEHVDVLQAVHELDSVKELAETIQRIYEYSFEQLIPMKECSRIAGELLIIKGQECELS